MVPSGRDLQWELLENDISADISANGSHGETATVSASGQGGILTVQVKDPELGGHQNADGRGREL